MDNESRGQMFHARCRLFIRDTRFAVAQFVEGNALDPIGVVGEAFQNAVRAFRFKLRLGWAMTTSGLYFASNHNEIANSKDFFLPEFVFEGAVIFAAFID